MKKIWHDEAWSEYCKCFIGQKNRIHTQRRIYECLKNDEPIDCLPDGVELSERVIDAYKTFA